MAILRTKINVASHEWLPCSAPCPIWNSIAYLGHSVKQLGDIWIYICKRLYKRIGCTVCSGSVFDDDYHSMFGPSWSASQPRTGVNSVSGISLNLLSVHYGRSLHVMALRSLILPRQSYI